MSPQMGVSRRGFVKGMAGSAAVPGAMAGMAAGSAQAAPDVSVAATVVRVSHSRVEPHALRVGVRASIQTSELALDNIVLVVDQVPFAASPEEIRSRIAESVQRQVGDLLAQRGATVSGEGAAVQVFGGVLG